MKICKDIPPLNTFDLTTMENSKYIYHSMYRKKLNQSQNKSTIQNQNGIIIPPTQTQQNSNIKQNFKAIPLTNQNYEMHFNQNSNYNINQQIFNRNMIYQDNNYKFMANNQGYHPNFPKPIQQGNFNHYNNEFNHIPMNMPNNNYNQFGMMNFNNINYHNNDNFLKNDLENKKDDKHI